MTVENQTNKKRVQGDGSTDTVTFNFKAISESDIKVYVYPDDLAFDDLEDYLLTGGGVDYDITLDADGEGGEIVFTTAPAADEIALIINELDFTQTADLPTEGNFNETAVETALDRLVMQNIQQQERVVRGLALRKEDPLAVDGFEGIFIEAVEAADRASRVLQFNETGDGVEAGLLTTDLADLNAIADEIVIVAGIAGDVSIVAANITDVQNAEENANIAKAAGGFTYTYSTTTTASDPGSGFLRFNNATLASATALYISETTGLSQAIAAELASWDDSTSTVHSKIRLFKQADPSVFVIFNITGTLTDNGTWDTLTVAYVNGSGSLANNDVVTIQNLCTGDKGDTGAPGTLPTANASGTVDAITANYTPDITLTDMQLAVFRSAGANTSTTPTFAPDGLTARTIVKKGGSALVAGDIGAAGSVHILQYNLANTRWELLNPAKVVSADLSGALTLPNNSTATTQSGGDNSTKVATTAYADAAAKLPFRTTSAATTIIASDKGGVVQLTGSTDRTWDATAVATLGANFSCELWNDSTAIITFDPNSSEQVDGLTTIKMYPGEHRRLTVNAGATAFTTGVIKGFSAVFDSSGSLTVAPGYTSYNFQLWSSGQSGASRATTGNAGGGAGGTFIEFTVPASKFVSAGSTETVTVGGTSAGVSGNTAGNARNLSSVTINGVAVPATASQQNVGPADAVAATSASGAAAAGGILNGVAMTSTGNALGYRTQYFNQELFAFGGDVSSGNAPSAGAGAIACGGGGGGCSSTAGGTRTGGTSVIGGNGGAGGANTGGNGTSGTQPGGGGGGAVQGGTSGAGAAGRVIIRGII